MKKTRFLLIGLMIAGLFIITVFQGSLLTGTTVLPGKSRLIEVRGAEIISVRPYDTLLTSSIRLRVTGNPVTGMMVKVGRTVIPEKSPGHYQLVMKHFKAATGNTILISIDRPLSVQRFTPILAKATVGPMAGFLTPAPDAVISLRSIARDLKVSWATGKPPYKLRVFELLDPKTFGPEVFFQDYINSERLGIPLSVFKPGKRYGIYVFYTMGNFSFKGLVSPTSRLSLRYSVGTYINTR